MSEAGQAARFALEEVRREDLTLLADRDALAARLAAVEALADEWEQAARQGNNEWSACLLVAVPELRAALATDRIE